MALWPRYARTKGDDREALEENWDSGKSGVGLLIWADCGVPVSECFCLYVQYVSLGVCAHVWL